MTINFNTIGSKLLSLVTLERVILVGLIVFLFFLNRCSNRKYEGQLADSQTRIDSLMLANQKWDSIHNADGETIITQQAIVTSSQDAIRNLTDSIFNLTKKQERRIREVIAYYSNRTSTGVDSIKIPYRDTLAMKRFSDSVEQRCAEVIKYMRDSTVTVPKPVKDSTAHYMFDFTLERDSLAINKIAFPDSLDIQIVEIKGGLLKKDFYGKRRFILGRSIQVMAKHSNPFVKTLGTNSVVYKPAKKFKWLEKALLVGAGIFIGVKLSP